MSYGFEQRQALVQEYFPNAPERCIKCPALAAAALKLSALGGDISVPDNLEVLEPSREAGYIIDHLARLSPKVMAVAEEMYSSCPDGAFYVDHTKSDMSDYADLLGLQGTVMCQTVSPVGYFTPYLSVDSVR